MCAAGVARACLRLMAHFSHGIHQFFVSTKLGADTEWLLSKMDVEMSDLVGTARSPK
jgi:hypothetical protein